MILQKGFHHTLRKKRTRKKKSEDEEEVKDVIKMVGCLSQFVQEIVTIWISGDFFR